MLSHATALEALKSVRAYWAYMGENVDKRGMLFNIATAKVDEAITQAEKVLGAIKI